MILSGNKIVVTSPVDSAEKLSKALSVHGADVISIPMIKISEITLNSSIENCLKKLETYNWLVFTSKNGVNYFFSHWNRLFNKPLPTNVKTAVVGNKTGEELSKYNVNPDFVSKGNTSVELLAGLKNNCLKQGDNMLLVLGNLAENTLQDGLSAIANIDRIDVYKTESEIISVDDIRLFNELKYNHVVFTSASGFNNYKKLISNIDANKLVSIGPQTTKAMINHGFKPEITAEICNNEGLVNELLNYYKNKQNINF
jgi:uroporphyrinogen-III synthase